MQTWRATELAEFLDRMEGDRYRDAFLVLATTGMRRGELLGLQWGDVDLEHRRVYIRRSRTAVAHKVHVQAGTKTGRGRAVDLDEMTTSTLRLHRTAQAQELLRLGITLESTTSVFGHVDGRPYHPERFSREFDRRVLRFGMRRIRLHDLRHTWATLALEAGVPVKIVSERLGHSSATITSDVYSHVTPTMQADAAERVAALLVQRPAAGS
ncbi:MAG TPA: site-specific integrase [Acidimicrobiia bacterium]